MCYKGEEKHEEKREERQIGREREREREIYERGKTKVSNNEGVKRKKVKEREKK